MESRKNRRSQNFQTSYY